MTFSPFGEERKSIAYCEYSLLPHPERGHEGPSALLGGVLGAGVNAPGRHLQFHPLPDRAETGRLNLDANVGPHGCRQSGPCVDYRLQVGVTWGARRIDCTGFRTATAPPFPFPTWITVPLSRLQLDPFAPDRHGTKPPHDHPLPPHVLRATGRAVTGLHPTLDRERHTPRNVSCSRVTVVMNPESMICEVDILIFLSEVLCVTPDRTNYVHGFSRYGEIARQSGQSHPGNVG